MEKDLYLDLIMSNMTDGVLSISFKGGKVVYANPAVQKILELPIEQIIGQSLRSCIPFNEVNDELTQLIVDAVLDKGHTHQRVVPFLINETIKTLRVSTSFLMNNGQKEGIVMILSDLTELTRVSNTFARFLSKEIVDHLLHTPDGLLIGGKKQEVTILMSDLRGFTAMSERMEPSDLTKMLNHYLEEMTDVIESYHGTIIEFIGDGIMTLFGAPNLMEDHAARGCAAAISMQKRLEDVNAWNKERGYPELMMGIGINTGSAVVGNIGSIKRTKYGVIGSSVNLAGRIESYTVDGEIYISEYTRDAMKNISLKIVNTLEIRPKGANGALNIHAIEGIGEPYNIYCSKKEDSPQALARGKVEVPFWVLEGKHIAEKSHTAVFLSSSDLGAWITSDLLLSKADNICLDIGEKLYAKVYTADGKNYELRFTSIPQSFKDWKKKCFM